MNQLLEVLYGLAKCLECVQCGNSKLECRNLEELGQQRFEMELLFGRALLQICVVVPKVFARARLCQMVEYPVLGTGIYGWVLENMKGIDKTAR